MKQTYVTTAIPYVNARPHVGFALELVQADTIARYQALCGGRTRLQTGTDENAYKNVLAAREQGLEVRELVDRNSREFRRLASVLNVAAADFVRTTEERHWRGVHALWERLRPGDLYRQGYRGLYCAGCEDFYQEQELVEGRCPEHGTAPAVVEEENYFFRLSAYQDELAALISSGRLAVIPAARQREVLRFIERGLRDISVSRRVERVGGWGIPVPGDPDQVIYVWIDALVNYLSGPGFGSGEGWREWWEESVRKIHVIGKNVWKFHAVYWPALLLSAGLPLPDEVVVHGFLTAGGRKIGKSLGNTVDPFACVERFGADGVRYYLLREAPPSADRDFSEERLRQRYNADLANGLGNLVSRLTVLAERGEYGCLAAGSAPAPPAGYAEALQAHGFDQALERVWRLVRALNQEVEAERPWEWLQGAAPERLCRRLDSWLAELRRIAHWVQPFLPVAGERVLQALAREPICALGDLFPRVG